MKSRKILSAILMRQLAKFDPIKALPSIAYSVISHELILIICNNTWNSQSHQDVQRASAANRWWKSFSHFTVRPNSVVSVPNHITSKRRARFFQQSTVPPPLLDSPPKAKKKSSKLQRLRPGNGMQARQSRSSIISCGGSSSITKNRLQYQKHYK